MFFCYKYMNVLSIFPLYCNPKRVRISISINLYLHFILIPLIISIYFSITNSSIRSSISPLEPQQLLLFPTRYVWMDVEWFREMHTLMLLVPSWMSALSTYEVSFDVLNRVVYLLIRQSMQFVFLYTKVLICLYRKITSLRGSLTLICQIQYTEDKRKCETQCRVNVVLETIQLPSKRFSLRRKINDKMQDGNFRWDIPCTSYVLCKTLWNFTGIVTRQWLRITIILAQLESNAEKYA